MIQPATSAAELQRALKFLADGGEQVAEIVGFLEQRKPIEGLWLARAAGRMLGTLWVFPTSTEAAVMIGPVVRQGTPGSVSRRLIAAAAASIWAHGYRRLDTFVVGERQLQDELCAAGFTPGARLAYLSGPAAPGEWQDASDSIQLEPYQPSRRAAMVEVVERTYVNSLDCRSSDAAFDAESALQCYASGEEVAGEYWFFVVSGRETVGCLLMADLAAFNLMELSYMGVVPEARGRRFGERAAMMARQIAHRANRARVVLAVDCENTPAYNAYMRAGYQVTDVRQHFSMSAP